ncbi:LysE family transporter [Asaia sp. BMEF1]|uniref:LysE family translocator n=1 Tax=Asaia sp. BMEF1 TaxID=3155932 RepID=UPI003F67E4EB
MQASFIPATSLGLSVGAIVSFLVFAPASSASPGLNNLLIMSIAGSSGLKRTLPCVMAITVAFGSMLVAAAMGGSAILQHKPILARIMGILGAGWMLSLAWTIARARPESNPADTLSHWGKTFLLCWTNPKAWMMALTTGTTYLP